MSADAIVIAGMQRSGATAIAGLLKLLGCDLPAGVVLPTERDPVASWESPEAVEESDTFLAAIGSGREDVRSIPDGVFTSADAREFEDWLVSLLEQEYGQSRQFVVKDARISRLAPLWINALERFGATPGFVIPIRNPLAVSAAVAEHDPHVTPPQALLLWLRYSLDVERHTRSVRRTFVSCESLTRDWQAQIVKIASELSVTWPRSSGLTAAEVAPLLPRDGRAPEVGEGVPSWVERTYAVLQAACEGAPVDHETLDAVRAELDEADLLFGSLLTDLRVADRSQATAASTREAALAAALAERAEGVEALAAETAGLEARINELSRQFGRAQRAHAEELLHERATVRSLRELADDQLRQIDAQKTRIEELESRRFMFLRRSAPTAQRSRRASNWLQSLSQLTSWLLPPRPRGLRHLHAYFALRRSGAFDTDYYCARYLDVAVARLDPLMHYIEHGAWEFRDPSASFSTGEHLLKHPELEAKGINPLLHFVKRGGVPERRAAAPASPAPLQQPVPEPAAVAPAPEAAPVVAASLPVTWTQIAGSAVVPEWSVKPLEATEQGDFVVLLSRQRSGTNALRSILDASPDVCCFNEVFSVPDRRADDTLVRESNYYVFLERYTGGSIERALPGMHERLFLDYLEYLRCLSSGVVNVIDVKYNATHALQPVWAGELGGAPFLFDVLQRHGVRVLHLTRAHHLRVLLSTQKARDSQIHTVRADVGETADRAVELDPEHTIDRFETWSREDALVARAFEGYERLLTVEYSKLFPGGGAPAPDCLREISEWLGFKGAFVAQPSYRKQSYLSLRDSIENFDELADALRDTRFSHFLEDEPGYPSAVAERVARG
ncbi:MAG TPA: hypothetical protein VFW85_11005 [Gaiellaceae bacterium]|nr:hypothetical protein [Gaiellaceae bacterium]